MQTIRKPKLGQNFLVDENARLQIAGALGDLSDRTVIEIGPGHGAISDHLASRAQRLIALELDRSLAAELRFRFRDQPNVEIVEGDVLAHRSRPVCGRREHLRCDRKPALLHHVGHPATSLCCRGAGPDPPRCPDDAAGGRGPRRRGSRGSRVWPALGHDTDVCGGGEPLYAAACGLQPAARRLLVR